MKTNISVLLISIILLFTNALEAWSDPVHEEALMVTNAVEIVPLAMYEYKGRHYSYSTKYLRLFKTPRWRSDQGEPALSVSSALSVAEKYGKSLNSDKVLFAPLKVVLVRWLGDIWFYDVQLEPSTPGHPAGWMQPIEVAVLMDGTVADRQEVVLDPSSQRYLPVKQ